jgi:outer membrane receptor protein involved in Fe transport
MRSTNLKRATSSILYAAGSVGLALNAAGAAAQSAGQAEVLDEVIVTANKREQELRDVAGSVSAYTGEQLKELGAQSLADYVTRLPGVVFNDYQPGVSEVVIRGVAATTYHEQGQTVAGYYINEIPLSEPGWPIVIPDVDTFDLERVEVLRGPQGTLFGSASLGGLVNYIARQADTSGFDAAVQTSVGSTSDSDDLNYGVKGMVNVPLIEDKLAVRAVALERRDAGYLDNVRTGVEDSNDLTTTGARISAVYTPSESTKVTWLSLYQETDLEDQTYATLPTMTRDTYVAEPHTTEMLLNSLRFDQDLGFGSLTVLGALADKESRIVFDYTNSFGPTYLAGNPTAGDGEAESKSRNVEVRLSSNSDSSIGWIVGAMYLKSEKDSVDNIGQEGAAAYIDANPALFGGYPGSVLAPNDVFDRYLVDRTDEEIALFGEVTFQFGDAWSLAAGGRLFEAENDNTVTRLPGISYPEGNSYTEGKKDDGFTPKVTLRFKPNDDLMLYGLYSEGFRVGGANPNPPTATGAARAYDSDGVKNYELGVRSTLAGGVLTLDATAFHIDWDDIQVRLFTIPGFFAYVTNAGGAQIDGVEFTGTVALSRNFEFQTNISYVDARTSEFVPDTFAPGGGYEKGATLPGSSEWTISNSLSFGFEGVALDPQFLISHRYLSEAPVAFSGTNEKGDYHVVDLRGTVNVSSLQVSLFVNNATNEYGVLNAPFADFGTPLGSIVRPRTIGVSVDWAFD